MKRYSFSCFDTEDQSLNSLTFETKNECWDGYDGPMYNFFNFLKGCGFVFKHDDEIGVISRKGNFRAASEN